MSWKKFGVGIVVLLCWCGSIFIALGMTPERTERFALLIRQLFPPGTGESRTIQLTTDLQSLHGEISYYEWEVHLRGQDTPAEVVLAGFVGYKPDRSPSVVTFGGTLANEEELKKLGERWEESEFELTKESLASIAGSPVGFGPSEDEKVTGVLKDIKGNLERFLSKSLGRFTLSFAPRPMELGGKPSFTWVATYFAPKVAKKQGVGRSNNEGSICEIQIEPFDGRVVSIILY